MRWAYLIFVSGRPLGFVDSSLEPANFLGERFSIVSGRARVNLVNDEGPDDEQCKDPAAEEDRDERPEGSAPHARADDYPWYSQGDCGKNSKDESTGATPV